MNWLDVPVRGGTLRAARWGDDDDVVLAIHGITASSMSWPAVARRIEDEHTVVAPDLRGRGDSAGLPGRWGMLQHAEDMVAVLDAVGAQRAVVAGHSMGAFVAVVLAAAHPDRVERLVLVDGGLPLSLPEGLDPDGVLDATLGPAISRLHETYPSRDAYADFWKAHPAFVGEWSDDVETYVQYDLTGDEPNLRSKVNEEAIRADGRDLLTNPCIVTDALSALTCPVTLVRAPRGLMNEPSPVQPDVLVEHWRTIVPQLQDELVPDTNHYTVGLGPRGSEAVARHLA
jgi:pimeloyl-ACP methyl ester carboxylesterase